MKHTTRDTCRVCDASSVQSVLSLGDQPVAARLLTADERGEAEALPVELALCTACGHGQMTLAVDRGELYADYLATRSVSGTRTARDEAWAAELLEKHVASDAALVAEVGSNDGTLLAAFEAAGIRAVGLEPSAPLVAAAEARGTKTVLGSLDAGTAAAFRADHGAPALVVASDLLSYVEDPVASLAALRELAGDAPIAVREPHLPELLKGRRYHGIHHERLGYFTASSWTRLLDRVGLAATSVKSVSAGGGSLALVLEAGGEHAPGLSRLAAEEERKRFIRPEPYDFFSKMVFGNRRALRDFIMDFKENDKSVGLYGASANAITMLNYAGLEADMVDFAFDKNPLKVGRTTPGFELEVLGADRVLEKHPDYMLLFNVDLTAEIEREQAAYHDAEGWFVTPLPEPELLEGAKR